MPAEVVTVAVRVTPDALRQVRGGHPWVYAGSVTSVRPEGRSGDLAVVFDARRKFAAVGLWDPDSPIGVRVLHRGRPRTVDADFWREALAAALARRQVLLDDPGTDAYRWVHGENDALPGLVVDRYGGTLVLKCYTSAWLVHLDDVVAALLDTAGQHGATGGAPVDRVVLRLARRVAGGPRRPGTGHLVDGSALVGDLPDGPVGFTEGGLRFTADVVAGQKTGHFLDQREHRRRVRDLAGGRRVLDVFSCTGGFTVNAAAGGAAEVHSVDLSPHAVAAVAHHLELNRDLPEVAAARCTATVGDASAEMDRLAAAGRRFDLVVVDPPSFASRAEQVPGALRAYARLTERALRLVEPGGRLLQASCSARVPAEVFAEVVTSAAAEQGVRLRDVEVTGHAVDHPVGFAQGEYLCAVLATVVPPGGRSSVPPGGPSSRGRVRR